MNENIDLTKILKDCPSGWTFYSSIYGVVKFWSVSVGDSYPIIFSCPGHGTHNAVSKRGLANREYVGECTFFPSKYQRDWSKFTAPWYKKEKFDHKTLKPFDKVLVRDDNKDKWFCDFFSHNIGAKDICISGGYNQCIPYNDETKHLVGTKDEAPEYYIYWEELLWKY